MKCPFCNREIGEAKVCPKCFAEIPKKKEKKEKEKKVNGK